MSYSLRVPGVGKARTFPTHVWPGNEALSEPPTVIHALLLKYIIVYVVFTFILEVMVYLSG